MSSASSTAAGSVVERVRIEKSAYRSFAVTVRPERPEFRRRSDDELGEAPHLVVQSLAVGEVAWERVLGGHGDRLELEVEIARVDAARAIAEQRADRPG